MDDVSLLQNVFFFGKYLLEAAQQIPDNSELSIKVSSLLIVVQGIERGMLVEETCHALEDCQRAFADCKKFIDKQNALESMHRSPLLLDRVFGNAQTFFLLDNHKEELTRLHKQLDQCRLYLELTLRFQSNKDSEKGPAKAEAIEQFQVEINKNHKLLEQMIQYSPSQDMSDSKAESPAVTPTKRDLFSARFENKSSCEMIFLVSSDSTSFRKEPLQKSDSPDSKASQLLVVERQKIAELKVTSGVSRDVDSGSQIIVVTCLCHSSTTADTGDYYILHDSRAFSLQKGIKTVITVDNHDLDKFRDEHSEGVRKSARICFDPPKKGKWRATLTNLTDREILVFATKARNNELEKKIRTRSQQEVLLGRAPMVLNAGSVKPVRIRPQATSEEIDCACQQIKLTVLYPRQDVDVSGDYYLLFDQGMNDLKADSCIELLIKPKHVDSARHEMNVIAYLPPPGSHTVQPSYLDSPGPNFMTHLSSSLATLNVGVTSRQRNAAAPSGSIQVDNVHKKGGVEPLPKPAFAQTDLFLSHTWENDELGRNNHARVKMVNEKLKAAGFKTWFDEEKMEKKGHIVNEMAAGIDNTKVVLVFVTKRYMEKVKSLGDDNCKREFEYAVRRKETENMIAIVMEPCMKNPKDWAGQLGMDMGGRFHLNFSEDGAEKDVSSIVDALKTRGVVATALQNPKINLLDGMGGRLDQQGKMLNDIGNDVKQLLEKFEISMDEPNKKFRFANEKAAIFWVNITRFQPDSSSGISFDDFFLGCFLHSGVEEDGIDFAQFSKLRGEIRRIFDKDQNGKISMMEYDAATRKETVEDICQRLAAQMLRSSTIPSNAPQSAMATPAAARAPTVVGGATSEPVYCSPSRAHWQLIASLQMHQTVSGLFDPRVLFGFAAVPRRLFFPDNLSPEEEQKVYLDVSLKIDYYHQSAPHIYIMVLKHLDISINSRPESFLNIGSGTGYLSSLIAVMQSWRGYNDGIEVNGTLAQFATERVRIFAKISKVDNSNVRIFSGNALDQRVLQRVTEGRKYQRIYVGAGILRKYIPTLLQLLSDGGRMLAPVYASPASEYGELILFQRNMITYTETVISNVSYVLLVEP